MSKNKKWLITLILVLMFGSVVMYDWFIVLPLFTAQAGFMFLVIQGLFATAIIGLQMSWKTLKSLF